MAAPKLNKDTARTGFIGLGLLGSRFARRLHSSGWNLEVWNHSSEQAGAVRQNGIPIAASVTALASPTL